MTSGAAAAPHSHGGFPMAAAPSPTELPMTKLWPGRLATADAGRGQGHAEAATARAAAEGRQGHAAPAGPAPGSAARRSSPLP